MERENKLVTLNDEENWETVIDFTLIKKGGIEINELIEALDFRLKQI